MNNNRYYYKYKSRYNPSSRNYQRRKFKNDNNNNVNICCGCILIHRSSGKILTVLNIESQNWGFPKGHGKKNETKEQTAIRELFEETSVECCVDVELLNNAPRISESRYHYYVLFVNECYNIKVDGVEIGAGSWKTLEELELQKHSQSTRRIISRLRKKWDKIQDEIPCVKDKKTIAAEATTTTTLFETTDTMYTKHDVSQPFISYFPYLLECLSSLIDT